MLLFILSLWKYRLTQILLLIDIGKNYVQTKLLSLNTPKPMKTRHGAWVPWFDMQLEPTKLNLTLQNGISK